MKEIYAITEKRQEGQTKPLHVLFGINKDELRTATGQTDARYKTNWNRDFTWVLLCTEETYNYIEKRLMFGGFDPYEIESATETYLKEMADMHFYKEVGML